jgi:DNA repair protein RadA/Sms
VTKTKVLHRCSSCGATTAQWAGRCATCGEWNTLEKEVVAAKASARESAGARTPTALSSISTELSAVRPTGLSELDRVLGGGLTPGSVTLLGGEPGIGKSTLVLQLCAALAAQSMRCLVVTGEESEQQVARRAQRLNSAHANVFLLAETDVETVLASVAELEPDLLVIDSVQTMNAEAESSPGSVAQVRECTQAFVTAAKQRNIATLLVGHVTKEGALAGPRVLEHAVDTVLEFEGDRHHALRFLRTTKHRFGATDEVGVMEMSEHGLVPVADASAMFLDDRQGGEGSIVVPTLHGRRPLLVELQSLVVHTDYPTRRYAQGVEGGRLSVVLAVLGRHAQVDTNKYDAYVSVIGGIRIDDPGADLGMALSMTSARRGFALPTDLAAFGEVGLGGDVRKVGNSARRLAEAERMGIARVIVPVGTPKSSKLECIEVSTVADAIRVIETNPRPKSKAAKPSAAREPFIDIDQARNQQHAN